ncbi:MAG: hypothetical protein HY815_08050 [Candidatus Riflebacteria bacterium]|nr:hypothetical protein [Candidatus Riflebacteria bacterium]
MTKSEDRCPICNQFMDVTPRQRLKNGDSITDDSVCPMCRENAVKIYCVQCARVIGKTPPQTFHNGVSFKADDTVHVQRCFACSPYIEAMKFVEIRGWEGPSD